MLHVVIMFPFRSVQIFEIAFSIKAVKLYISDLCKEYPQKGWMPSCVKDQV